MYLRRTSEAFARAGLMLGLASSVNATSIVNSVATATLGRPLDFPIQVRLDSGEQLSEECVSAEVSVAEQRLPPSSVRVVVDHQSENLARVRVVSLQAVDEPVVSITLRVSCGAQVTRRFVVFADPPRAADTVVLPASQTAPGSSEAASSSDATGSPPLRQAVDRPNPAVRPSSAARAPRRATVAAAARVVRPAAVPANATPHLPAPAKAEVASPGPRLVLDPMVPAKGNSPAVSARSEGADVIDSALLAVSQAASAAEAAASAARASAERVALLERTVTQLRLEAQSSQATAGQLRDKLAQVRSPGIGHWTWPLLLTSLALGGLVAWLSWRLGRLQSGKKVAWERAAAPSASQQASRGMTTSTVGQTDPGSDQALRAATGPAPFLGGDVSTQPPLHAAAVPAGARSVTGLPKVFGAPAARPTQGLEIRESGGTENAMLRTEPLPVQPNGEATVRDVSIEELIDLEQQAEFFMVLGQDEAAIDLLVDHLRSTGGGSPLPYLKLLEIYSRRGDRSAYERNRARFNHRFNAYAPEWGSDLAHGRTLEDYAGILPRLAQVWPRPLDAMAELEALLFRKSRGELFELPAYREVLFLYSLARDLLDRESADTGTVDLLLPLADGSDFSSTEPAPFIDVPPFVDRHAPPEPSDHSTRPVDFDLTIPAQQSSIFDPVEEITRPKRR